MARNLELEAAITANPSNDENYSVYADWLESQGDPRGRLIAMTLNKSPSDGKLNAMMAAYMSRNEAELLGPVCKRVAVQWGRGFFDHVGIDRSYVKEPIAPLLAQVLEHPSAALLRSIALHDAFAEDDAQAAIATIAHAAPRALRSLSLHFDRDVGSLAPLYGLDLVYINIGYVLASRADFAARRAAVSSACVQSITASPWRLRGLELAGGVATDDDLLPLLGRDLPLDELVLKRPARQGFSRELIAALVAAPFARRLTKLWLWGDIERDDYRILVDNRDVFRKLRDVQLPSKHFVAKLLQRTTGK